MPKEVISDWIASSVIVPVVHTLDKKMKRLVTIASLFGYLFNNSVRNKQLEERLSKIMNLTEHSSSLTLPLVHHNLIWKEIEKKYKGSLLAVKRDIVDCGHTQLTKEEVEKYANMFISLLPSYLVYDSVENIKQDVMHLFESLPFILGENSVQVQ